ncbi:MAG: hypothetical protein QM726_09465 [Chitinophagaceae bacterium]
MKSGYPLTAMLSSFFSKTMLAAFFLLGIASSSFAQKQTMPPANDASVSYQGYSDDQYSFIMKYENSNGEKFKVTVTDSEGNLLYNEMFHDKKFSKVFRTKLETGSLTFVINNFRKKEEMKFKVNAERHMMEDFSVSKAN